VFLTAGEPSFRSTDPFARKAVIVYTALVCITLAIILVRLHGVFSYSLDDPYIHLALSQQIAHGHYGINAGEPSSPSSSVLWPFLLAPFSRLPGHTWAPLLLNLLPGWLECLLLAGIVQRWQLLGTRTAGWLQWAAAAALVICANLVGLTFLGMEHNLQLVTVTGCVWGILEAYAGRPVPRFALWMAILAPAVRFEDLAVTTGVVLACLAQRRWRAGLGTLLATLALLALFSVFLVHEGLAPLPTSVLTKGGLAGAHSGSALHSLLVGALLNLRPIHDAQWRTLSPGILVFFAGLLLNWKSRTRRTAMLCALVAIVLLWCFGPFGWFYRYDTALRLILLIMCLVALQGHRFAVPVSLLLVAGWISFYTRPLLRTPDAAVSIGRQQYQMHRFEDDFYRGNVAVDDLGWVAMDHPQTAYVLDLDGLASPEAAKQKTRDAAWLQRITEEHHVALAMVYPSRFLSLPATWVLLGTLTEAPVRYGVVAGTAVRFYATSPEAAPALQSEVNAFRRTLPAEDDMAIPSPPPS
jgi:hypothetical protein